MKTTRVMVLPYDKAWKTAFENIRAEIENAIGDLILDIEQKAVSTAPPLSVPEIYNMSVHSASF